MSVQINNTIIRFNTKTIKGFGAIIGVENFSYRDRKEKEISIVLLCFLLDISIITPKK